MITLPETPDPYKGQAVFLWWEIATMQDEASGW